ncbi:autotransporter domain-containing protein [Devosia oryziradicis]|uniref:Autotransporter domain-containing protein n=1 Tax=Devosia oryziradicis TaxID=2801335 RepID=A0ABX7BY91_9HYPH|nr:autotransporter domain-containing protein [Devosia oryziradicis]QQR34781.1 autotransporter domain-containing protein [Devosia oryziradicis]
MVTTAGFAVDTTANGAPSMSIEGNGSLSYVDTNASALVSDNISLGVNNLGGGAGEVLVVSNGAISSTNAAGAAVVVGNAGLGNVTVALSGPITGPGGGIIAGNSDIGSTGAISITTGTVNAGTIGIAAIQSGAGALNITTAGPVTGGVVGILGVASPLNVDGVRVNAQSVTGGTGIAISNLGMGTTDIAVGGTVAGTTGAGLQVGVDNVVNLGGLALDVANATGNLVGIAVSNAGLGATRVTSTGKVVGLNGPAIGVVVSNQANANDVVVDVNSVTGDDIGILTSNDGLGATLIAARGVVEAQTAVWVNSASGAAVELTIDGEVRSTLGVGGRAVDTVFAGATQIINNNSLSGTVDLSAFDDLLVNAGTWNVVGISTFGQGFDEINNHAGGVLRAAHIAGVAETTSLLDLDAYFGGGTLSLADGGGDDRLVMSGDAVFMPGAVQDIDLGATPDVLTVGGTADLGDATLRVRLQSGYVVGQTFAILETGAGLTGRYGRVEGGTAYLGLLDSYDANNAYLQLVLKQALSAPGRTRNQIATGKGLESLAMTDPLVTALLAAMTDDEARAMLDNLSGEIHGSVQSSLLRESRLVREAVWAHLRSSLDVAGSAPALAYAASGQALTWQPELTQIWSEAIGSWGRTIGDGNAADMQTRTGGVLVGADSMVGDWRLGLLLGYGSTRTEVPQVASSAESKAYQVGLYGGTAWGDVAFRTGMAYAWNDISTTRTVISGGTQTLTAQYGASTAQAFGELAYMVDLGTSTLEPFANAALVGTQNGAFSEKGGSAALSTQASTNAAAFTTLGMRAAAKFVAGETALVTVSASAGWRHGWGGVPQVQNSFAGGTGFAIAGPSVSGSALVLDGTISADLSDQLRVRAIYNGLVGPAQFDQSIEGALTVRF